MVIGDFLVEICKCIFPNIHITLYLYSIDVMAPIGYKANSILSYYIVYSYILCPWEKKNANICTELEFCQIIARLCTGRKKPSSFNLLDP